ncbi:MAG: NAD+ synthase [Gammaproteobacteria bacterium]|nr:NAD+ synthase [Gammaproteobacteria bacterium]
MSQEVRIALAQINVHVGDLVGNTNKIISHCKQQIKQADVIVFSELSITGYPPEDLLLREQFLHDVKACLLKIQQFLDAQKEALVVVVGSPQQMGTELFNAAFVLKKNTEALCYCKQRLPNYGVFDEKRYFIAGSDTLVFKINGVSVGISICEDIWTPDVVRQCKAAGAELILNLNASPYHIHKHQQRLETVKQRVIESGLGIVYVNQVGGQDELLFDGHSFVMDALGDCVYQASGQQEHVAIINYGQGVFTTEEKSSVVKDDIGQLYQALVRATKDYVLKNGFKGALLGLSGGIDSALVLAIAADALGADALHAVMMPYQYTADMSITDAELEAKALGVKYSNIAIHDPVDAFLNVLSTEFANTGRDTTEENIQARARGVILMALSNKTGKMLLTTGNKSEMSVGYATLYGDMAGGFAPLKDVSKLRVFELAKYRNTISPVIPERVITRPPSAELSPDQTDLDSLPAYDVLDPILEAYVEQQLSSAEIIEQGFKEDDVKLVVRLVDMNEYKRRQSPPGVKVTERSFGKERRYPITSAYKG